MVVENLLIIREYRKCLKSGWPRTFDEAGFVELCEETLTGTAIIMLFTA